MGIFDRITREARRDGGGDECVFEQVGRHVRRTHDEAVYECPLTRAETRHLIFEVDRGVSWEEAVAARDAAAEAAPGGAKAKAKAKARVDGFYTMDRKGTRHVLLAVERQASISNSGFSHLSAPSWFRSDAVL